VAAPEQFAEFLILSGGRRQVQCCPRRWGSAGKSLKVVGPDRVAHQGLFMFKVIVLVMAIASVSCAVRGVAQSVPPRPVTIQDLTVPKERLPTGCGLSPTAYVVEGNRVTGGLWAGLEIPTNPWTGTARRVIASIREHMDGPSLVPDGPPPTARELSRYRLLLADGVEEAYAAIYTQSDTNPIVVSALRFAVTERPFSPPHDEQASNHRVEIGPFDAVVSGDNGQCSQAVEAYLESLARELRKGA
jgi:hypothetical protein